MDAKYAEAWLAALFALLPAENSLEDAEADTVLWVDVRMLLSRHGGENARLEVVTKRRRLTSLTRVGAGIMLTVFVDCQ